MKSKNIAIIAGGLILGVIMISFAFAYTNISTVSLTSQGTVPIVPGPNLDDFNSGVSINLWNGSTGTLAKSGSAATCAVSYPSSPDPVTSAPGKCLRLDYNVSETDSYAGYYSSFGGGGIGAYTNLSFWVKGSTSGILFKVELKNNSTTTYGPFQGTYYYRNKSTVYINDFLSGGVTTSWKKVTIPIRNFANLDGTTAMKEFAIVFENTAVGSNLQGSIYIDNITFDSNTVSIVPIDYYESAPAGICDLGGYISDGGTNGSVTHSFTTAAAHSGSYGLQLDYDVAGGGWAYTYSVFGGGNDAIQIPDKSGWVDVPCDFSAYNNISFWIKPENDTRNPRGIKVELGAYFFVIPYDNSGAPNFPRIPDSTWQKYTIPLANFKDWGGNTLNKSSISKMVFTLEYVNANFKRGTVYIDDVQFE